MAANARRARWIRGLLLLAAAATLPSWSCEQPAALTGVGVLDADGPLVFAARLSCEGDVMHLLEVRSDAGTFSLGELGSAFCRDDPALDPGVPSASFDTLTGGGHGIWRPRSPGAGREGASASAYASFTFADAGEGSMPDYAEITVTAPDGSVVIDVAGTVKGNLEANGTLRLREAPGEDPIDALHSAVIDRDGRAWGYRFARLGRDDFGEEPPADEAKRGGTPREPPKIDPDLADLIARGNPDDRVRVVMNLKEDIDLPHFPDLWRPVRCDDPLRLAIAPKLSAQVESLLGRRRIDTDGLLRRFHGGVHTIRVVEQFWLVNAFVADVRLGDVVDLTREPDLVSIEPADRALIPPMVDGDPGNDIYIGRLLMNSDPLAAQPGMNGGCIGLLDTGVHETHVHFTAPPGDNLGIDDSDCDGGGPSCQDTSLSTFDSEDFFNHGTGTASILSGNDVYGPNFRGVTDILVDSWKVYPGPQGSLIGSAVAIVNGLQRALEIGDRVILAELQLEAESNGVVATAADAAFDTGAVVLATAGNCAVSPDCLEPEGTPMPETIRSPANAHKVIGVGAYPLSTLETPDYQSYGPTEDLRIKPEIQTPTDAEAASQCGANEGPQLPGGGVRTCIFQSMPDQAMRRHGGTSGAGPFATGVAALVRNRLRKFGTWEPGNTYAQMILKGDNVYPYDEREGVGHLRLDLCTVSYWGKVLVPLTVLMPGHVPAIAIPVPVVNGYDRIEAAIWWPETATGPHNDLDLYLLDPDGNVASKGIDDHSVFERVEAADPAAGTWTLKIKSYARLTSQFVYWALDVVGCDVATVPDDLPEVMP